MIYYKAIKNNKATPKGRIYDISYNGLTKAVVIRINGITTRRQHQGENQWDIFLIVTERNFKIEICSDDSEIKKNCQLGKYNGQDIYLELYSKVDGILGKEEKEIIDNCDIENMTVEESLKDVEIVHLVLSNESMIIDTVNSIIESFEKGGGMVGNEIIEYFQECKKVLSNVEDSTCIQIL